MAQFTKTEENYIAHEVELRVQDKKFKFMEMSFQSLVERFSSLEERLNRLEDKLDSSIKHLDNKFMLMFGVILGSIWLPAILHYLHIT